MDDTLETEIHYSIDDYVRGLTFVQGRSVPVKYGFIIVPSILLAVLVVQFLLNPNLLSQLSLYYSALTFAPILLVVGLFLSLKYLPNPFLRRNIQKQVKSSLLLQQAQRISFDEVGIKGQTNLSTGETKWQAITEATETNDDFFFFTSNKHAIFVPKKCLTVNQTNTIRELAKRNLGEKAKF
jgi:hypothetical protein